MSIISMGAADAHFTTDWQAACPPPEWGDGFKVKKEKWIDPGEDSAELPTRIILEAEVWPHD